MKEKPTKVEEIFEVDIAELELHPLAKTTPRMTDKQYTALKADIEINGQLEPITLYRGRIVDGRHRWLILQELGIESVLATKLSNNTTTEKLKSIVKSKETRRHETPTQLAISAYRLMLNSKVKLTIMEAAEIVGADRRKVSDAKSIAEVYKRPDILEMLFDGDKFNVGTTYVPARTDSLPSIMNWLKEQKASKKLVDTRGKIEMTEAQFTECAVISKEILGLDIRQIEHIANALYTHVKDYKEDLLEQRNSLIEGEDDVR